jgi:hypothetical protein
MIDFPKGVVVLSRKLKRNPGKEQTFRENPAFYWFGCFSGGLAPFFIIPFQPVFRKENGFVRRVAGSVWGRENFPRP